jgi:hypothetical protein
VGPQPVISLSWRIIAATISTSCSTPFEVTD